MTKILTSFLTAAFLSAGNAAVAAPLSFGGIDFPDGAISFADRVASVSFGSPAPDAPNFTDPNEALGTPDYNPPGSPNGTGAYSLGNGGSITLEFVDNRLTGSGSDAFDLHIFEVGPQVEAMDVEISVNGTDFLSVGRVGGSTSSVDIDSFLAASLEFDLTSMFRFVRLTDDPQNGSTTGGTVGADIDAIGAISTVAVPVVPLPAGGLLLITGLAGLAAARRRQR